MKTILGLALAFALLSCSCMAQSVYHNGYVNQNGTYVQPHYQSSPDQSYNNNWNVKPNVNPYTGEVGTRQPTFNDRPPQPCFGCR